MAKSTMENGLSALRGSRAWTEAEARRVLDALETSGDTVTTFARRVGFVPQRVYWWRARLSRVPATALARAEGRTAEPAFLPVVLRPAATASVVNAPVTVRTRGGLRVEVTTLDPASAAWVAMLVRSFEQEATS